ncbi:MAG: hypothetical protein HYX38_29940 [Rhodospirillales bacterium]|nr:hypothetical protein [Rhodospirillales bacterium]
MRQAVIIIHGIGEQRPMETLRAFVAGAFGVEKEALNEFVFSKPDRIDDTLELRRLSASTKQDVCSSPLNKGCETDFYELYWQHLMSGTTWSSVLLWIYALARGKLTNRLRRVRRSLSILVVAAAAATVALALGLQLLLESSPLWRAASETLILSISLAGLIVWLVGWSLRLVLRSFAKRIFLDYVGDAARYLTPDPPNIKARRDIRAAGLALLRGLHEDELRRYERIILVGHSLGSVIAYDLITWFWQERHHRREVESRVGKQETAVMDHAESELPHAGSPQAELVNASGRTIPVVQRALWRKLREGDHRLPWRITDLITLGSPLAHADALLARGKEAFDEGKRQREFPTCPPAAEDARDCRLLLRTYRDRNSTSRHIRILHHAAPFAVTRWTNLYFPGDVIGGPVAPLFGKGVRDVKLHAASRGLWDHLLPALSHTRYWNHAAEKHASCALRCALRLNEYSDPAACPAGAAKAPEAQSARIEPPRGAI